MSHSIIDAPNMHPIRDPNSPSGNVRSVEVSVQDQASDQVGNITPRGPVRRGLSLVLGSIGPMLVLVAFAAVFYFGHHNDWKIPKFAAMTGTVEPVISDWCEEHSVPESICLQCDPTLMLKEPDYGWCPEHGVHNCPLHHPDVAQLKETPSVLATDLERAARALAIAPRSISL